MNQLPIVASRAGFPVQGKESGVSLVRSCVIPRREGAEALSILRAQVQLLNQDLQRNRQPQATRGKSMGPLLSLSSKDLGLVVRNAQATLATSTRPSVLPPTGAPNPLIQAAVASSQVTDLFLTQAQSNSLRTYKYVRLAECNGFRAVPDRRSLENCHILNYYEEFRAAKERRLAEIKTRFRRPPRPFALLSLHRPVRDGSLSLPRLR